MNKVIDEINIIYLLDFVQFLVLIYFQKILLFFKKSKYKTQKKNEDNNKKEIFVYRHIACSDSMFCI